MKNIIKLILLFPLISCSPKINGESKHEETIKPKPENVRYAYFSSGCFWGTEYWFEKANGIFEAVSGYAGGHKANPTYREVCTGLTGHLETVRVGYDASKTSYEDLVRLFFETHNFTQANGQGPDIGSQYLSAIFYQNDEEKNIAEKYAGILESKGYKVATTIRPFKNFYEAEDYHQDYYEKKGSTPYCHIYKKIF